MKKYLPFPRGFQYANTSIIFVGSRGLNRSPLNIYNY